MIGNEAGIAHGGRNSPVGPRSKLQSAEVALNRVMRHSAHRLCQTLVVFLGVAVFTACSTVALAQSEADLPDIGNPAGAVFSKNDELAYGMMVEREMRAENQILEDPETAEYIQSLGTRLAAQSIMGAANFHYYVIDDPGVNAFSVPYYIFCNYGLILATENESQLAGVLAHETAHDTQHHIARDLQAQTRQSLTMAAAMLAAVLIGAAGGGAPAIEGGIAAAQGMAIQQEINFTRTEEEEADRVGMTYLSQAGFDPEGMPDFFETLQQKYGYEEGLIPKFLLDHPVTSDRIADARARAAHLERPKNLKDSVEYTLIRERLRVLKAPEGYDILGYYRKHLETRTPTLADQYGEAIALLQAHRPTDAVEVLEPLVAQYQGVTLLRSALGQAQVAAGQIHDGLTTFSQAEVLFPRNVPLTIRYAEALIKVGQPKQAHDLLNDLFNNVEPTPSQIQLIAQAAIDAGDKGDAYDYMGEYYISNGNFPLAAQQLELALRTPHLTNVQRERFLARLTEVRDFITEERRENHGRDPNEEQLDLAP
jgi:beta-barrel assembly-enhancing protease